MVAGRQARMVVTDSERVYDRLLACRCVGSVFKYEFRPGNGDRLTACRTIMAAKVPHQSQLGYTLPLCNEPNRPTAET